MKATIPEKGKTQTFTTQAATAGGSISQSSLFFFFFFFKFKTTGEEGDGWRQVSPRSPSGGVEGWVHVEQVAAVLMLYIQCQTLRDCLVGWG